MFPENSITTGKTIALFAILMVCSNRVFAEEPDELYGDLPLSNTANERSPPIQPSASRISDFFKLEESASDILSQTPGADIQEPDSGEQPATPEFSKRVFCNGFTGCKGRFRKRRRMPDAGFEQGKQLLTSSKRPFCNSYGCYNSGRKRSSPSGSKNQKPQTTSQKVFTFADGWPWVRMKKLFCNGYGGCQNMGKRLSQLKDSIAKDDIPGFRMSSPFSKTTQEYVGGKKRLITSDYDGEMMDLADSLRR